MVTLAVVVAMFLVQAQPLVGAVLCERHHEQSAAAGATTAEHHQPGSGHSADHGDSESDDQCAITHACAAATPVIRVDAAGPARPASLMVAPRPAVADRLVTGWHSPPYHPPKA